MKDLAESLRENLQTNNDSTLVYCKTENDEGELDKDIIKNAIRLMKSETNHQILLVTDKDLAA